jgi:hypothetical protein
MPRPLPGVRHWISASARLANGRQLRGPAEVPSDCHAKPIGRLLRVIHADEGQRILNY